MKKQIMTFSVLALGLISKVLAYDTSNITLKNYTSIDPIEKIADGGSTCFTLKTQKNPNKELERKFDQLKFDFQNGNLQERELIREKLYEFINEVDFDKHSD